jgi:dTDP-4-dehydrorhamnose reductase
MKFRILLTGKNGQVGSELAALLPRLGEVVAFDRQRLDLRRPEQIRRAIRDSRPNVIVNAAAYTSVDQAENEQAEARCLNADAPALMAEEARRIGAILVHFSTDYVFDGTKDSPYDEDDPPNPINVYGETKLAGERAIRAIGVRCLIFRTSWVYGTRGKNFLLKILRLATEREELRIVGDQVGAPTWSREIAKATTEVLSQLSAQGRDAFLKHSEVYHMTAAGETSWFEFAEAILGEASRIPRGIPWFDFATGGHPLLTRRVTPITTEQFPTPARRPAYSVLSNLRLKQDFGLELLAWQKQLRLAFGESRFKRHSIDS